MILKIIYDIWLSWDLVAIEPFISYYSGVEIFIKIEVKISLKIWSFGTGFSF